MARCLFPAHGMFFTFYLILGALTPIELQHLDQECLKYNLASFGPTNQSSNWNASSVASKAVDGDHKTCSQTAETNNTWWQVDLRKEINVSLIQVTNSPKYPLVIRITVSKHMNQNGSSCGVKHILEGGETRWIVCVPHILGRYVKIQPGDKQKSLSLCEVQVFDQTVKLTEGVIYKAWFDISRKFKPVYSLQSLYNHTAFTLDKPDSQGVLSTFQSPRDIAHNYGIVMITYYNAPETGNYTFYMSGDDNSKLLKGLEVEVAAIPTRNGKNKDAEFTPFEEWNGSISKPQLFEKDKVYMLTGQMKENGGLDHLRVSVRLPNGHYELPMKHRLYTSENAAQERSTNNCNSTSCRYCRCDDEECRKLTRDKPVTDICNKTTTTQKLSNLYQSLLNGKTSPINTSKELVKLTSNTTEFVPDDLALITLTLENIVDNTAVLNETGPNIMKTVNNILNVQTNVIGDSERNNQSSNRILFVISKYLGNVPIKRGKNVSQDEGNIAVYAQDWNVTQFQGVRLSSLEDLKNKDNGFIVLDDNPTDVSQPSDTQVSLTIPKTSLEIKTATEQRLFFVVYRKTILFQSKSRISSNVQTVKKLNSFVISATVKGQALQNLTEPVQCVYHPLEKGINESTECVFWDFKLKNGQGDWSGDGCYYKGTDNGLVTCHCFHLTNFAILVDIYIDDHNDGVHDKALSIISYIGCAVSLFGLVLMIITILLFKDLRSQAPTQILLNFCIALSLTLIVFLTAAERSKTSSMVACRAAAVALHYFVLVVFMWMAIQAFNMFLAFVVVMHKYYSRFILKCCIAGWGIPAIIVIITAATSMDYYGDEHFCRVKGLPFFVAFLAPVLVILLGNIIAFVLIFRSLLASETNLPADLKVSGLHQAKRAAIIIVVLGLTWLFGILAVGEAKLLFQYLFCIFNSIQGLLVFTFYCLLSAETRAKYESLLCEKHSAGSTFETRFRHAGSYSVESGLNSRSMSSCASPNVVVVNVQLNPVTTNQ